MLSFCASDRCCQGECTAANFEARTPDAVHKAGAAGYAGDDAYVMMSAGSVPRPTAPELVHRPPAPEFVFRRGQREQASASASFETTGKTREIRVTVRRGSVHEHLGLHVRHAGARLVIVALHSDAAVCRSSADSVAGGGDGLEVGDVIVQINGVSGNVEAMLQECKEKDTLVVHALRLLDTDALRPRWRKSGNANG